MAGNARAERAARKRVGGRRYAPDERDRGYPLKAVIPRARAEETRRYWYANGLWSDQGQKPHCVAHAWLHWLEDSPITHPEPGPVVDAALLYREAQRQDEWPGEGYDGTSVRAGAKVLQARGMIGAYYWAQTIGDVVKALLTTGPLVVGTDWYEGMMEPNGAGLVEPRGAVIGGHAYVLNGINRDTGLIRGKNSWGREWGRKGAFTIRISDFETLLRQQGEACIATEVRQ